MLFWTSKQTNQQSCITNIESKSFRNNGFHFRWCTNLNCLRNPKDGIIRFAINHLSAKSTSLGFVTATTHWRCGHTCILEKKQDHQRGRYITVTIRSFELFFYLQMALWVLWVLGVLGVLYQRKALRSPLSWIGSHCKCGCRNGTCACN